LPGRARAPPQAGRRLVGRVRRPQAAHRRRGAAGCLPGVQFPAARGGAAGIADARRRAHPVPRVRPRSAPSADAGRLSEPRRHQRRGLGRGGAAEPVPGELRLAPGGSAAHLRALRERCAAAEAARHRRHGRARRVTRRLSARVLPAPLLLLCAVASPAARAETLYVIEQLVVSVNSAPDSGGERVASVRSGDALEVLERSGDQVHVRTAGGKEGWIRASYLSAEEPLRPRLAQRTAEVAQLEEEVSGLQAQLDAAPTAPTTA